MKPKKLKTNNIYDYLYVQNGKIYKEEKLIFGAEKLTILKQSIYKGGPQTWPALMGSAQC